MSQHIPGAECTPCLQESGFEELTHPVLGPLRLPKSLQGNSQADAISAFLATIGNISVSTSTQAHAVMAYCRCCLSLAKSLLHWPCSRLKTGLRMSRQTPQACKMCWLRWTESCWRIWQRGGPRTSLCKSDAFTGCHCRAWP